MKRRAASLLGGRLRGLVASAEENTLPSLASGFFGARAPAVHRNLPSSMSQIRAAALPAQQVATKLQPDVLPLTHTDEVGAISIVEPHEKDFVAKEWENVDGRRIEDGRYAAFIQDVSSKLYRPASDLVLG
jgi:D-lactate dehydrogenase